MFPSNALILFRESKASATSSSALIPGATAKSGLPTSPKNRVSPVNRQAGFDSLSINKKQELSLVCPGV